MAITAGILGMGCSTGAALSAVAAPGGGGATATAVASPTLLAARTSSPIEDALLKADSYFITQYHHVKYNPSQGGTNNANCGPTSLAMALKAFGAEPAELAEPARAPELIRKVRQAMTGKVDENTWTYPIQVRDGARKLGLQAQIVYGLDDIRRVMSQPGRLMVININPSPAYSDQLVFPYNGGHFALLTRIQGDRAYVSDPLAPHPIEISLKQLDTALTTPLGKDPDGGDVAAFDGGIALWQ